MKTNKLYRILRGLRVTIASLTFIGCVLLFSGVLGKAAVRLSVLAKIQLLPAILSLNVAIVAAIALITLLFGRIYCSTVCPLGLLQDVALAVRRLFAKKLPERKPACAMQWTVRVLFFVAVMALAVMGLGGFSLFEPYGMFGRFVATFTSAPVVKVMAVEGSLFALIVALAAWRGRVWCNAVCPVGTGLGVLSCLSLFKIRIDGNKCVTCKKCEKICKGRCISISKEKKTVENSKCVECFDCAAKCPVGAISFSLPWSASKKCDDAAKVEAKADGVPRRGFIATATVGTAALAAKAEDKVFDGGLAPISDPGTPDREVSLKPAGSHGVESFGSKCVGCQLCVKACPNKVLRPSTRTKDFMQPEMGFDKGYCTLDCHRCGDVCPAGAINRIAPEDKRNIHIGRAVWHKDICIAACEGVNCTACFRHCPVHAISRVKLNPDDPKSPLIPVVDETKCIGCGACEHVCPARPMPGMQVRGFVVHHETLPMGEKEVLAEALSIIDGDHKSCVVVKNGVIVASEDGRGVAPLLKLLDREPEMLKGSMIVDKVIGRAALAVCLLGGVTKVYGKLVSNEAIGFAKEKSIGLDAGEVVPRILNRKKDGPCPLEASVEGLSDPSKMVEAIRAKIRTMKR